MSDNKQKLISVCIPTYEMHGLGHIFLKQSFDILVKQTFKDFNIIISDYSKSEVIENVCNEYKNKLDIKYFKNTNPIVGMSLNVNNVINHATGKLIKILFLDDLLYDEKSLEIVAKNFDLNKDKWLVTACEHSLDGKTFYKTHYPKNNKNIHLGKNTIGSPSVLTMINENVLQFDTNLKWFMDCDYYKRLYDKYGSPKIVNEVVTVIRTGDHQATNNEITREIENKERTYIYKKYNVKTKNLNLRNTTLVAVSGLNPAGAIRALEISMNGVDYYDVVLIAHYAPDNLDKRITFKKCKDTELVNQNPKDTTDYSRFMAYNLCDYIKSDYVLIVHNDAYVLRPHKWDNRFFDYDYIGAPWPANIHYTNEGMNVRIGNGGFSFRSKRMLNILNDLNLPFTDNGTGFYNEDGIMCVYYRKILEDNGIKFAPVPIASIFSHEITCIDSEWKPFGFHNNKKVIPLFFFCKQNFRQWRRNRNKSIGKNRFEKHVKLTMAIFLIAILIILDITLGSIFLPKGVRVDNRMESPYFHHTLKSNYKGTDTWVDGTYPLITNSLGFKDKVVRDISSTTAKHRIVFIGDSFTEGIGIPYENTFVGKIDERLDQKKYDVLNAGVVSYSPHIYYLKTKYLIDHGLKFDELIVFDDISDVQDELTYRDWLPSDPSQLKLSAKSLFRNLDFFFEHHSLIYLHTIRPLIFTLQSDTSKNKIDKEYIADRGRWTFDNNVFEDWGEKGLELEAKNMDELYKLCIDNNIKLSIVVYPWPDQIINKDINSRQVSYWQKFSKERGINFYNLFPAFISTSTPSQKVIETYFLPQNDVHWNTLGHELIAKEWLKAYINNK